MIKNIGLGNSLVNEFMGELRNEKVQNDSLRFRRNLERLGEIFAYEISKEMPYQTKNIKTPLGDIDIPHLKEQPVLSTILRAGLPVHNGMLNYFDKAENAFISAYRKYSKDGSFHIQFEHLSCPKLTGKHLIISDPMLASGASMVLAYRALLEKGTPMHTHIVALISSREGVEHLRQNLDMKKVTFWTAAIDDELTAKSYIVPGLGDAGDLAFGPKL